MISNILKSGNYGLPNEDRGKIAYNTGLIGLVINIVLALVKVILGILTGSVSIAADGANNVMDSISSVVTIVGVKLANQPADKNHPYGHGRIEYVAALVVSALVVFVGFEFLKSSVEKIFNPQVVVYSTIALVGMILSIVVKFLQYILYNSVSVKINSSPLRANAVDSLNDVLTTSIVVIGMIMDLAFNLKIDGYIGVIISLFILKSGIELVGETIDDIIGKIPPKEFLDTLRKEVSSYNYVLGVHNIVVNNFGPEMVMVTLDVEMPFHLDFMKSHDLVERIQEEVGEKLGITLSIHVDPVGGHGIEPEIISKIKSLINIDKGIFAFHDLTDIDKTVKFTIIVDGNIYKSPEDTKNIEENFKRSLEEDFPDHNFEITVKKEYYNEGANSRSRETWI